MGLFSKDIQTMDDLLLHGLQDVYYAENQIVKALPKMIDKATNRDLSKGLKDHLEETEKQIGRLDQVFKMLEQKPKGVKCPAIDGLIRDFPNDPYYRELKGQMLFENGRVRDALRPYEDAVKLAPSAALLRMSLSQVYIESGDPALNKRAIAYLNDASRVEGRESQIWHFLAVAYGRDNQIGMAALSLAEEALANGKKKDAMQQSNRAKQMLTKNTPSYFRADDIHREAEHLDD